MAPSDWLKTQSYDRIPITRPGALQFQKGEPQIFEEYYSRSLGLEIMRGLPTLNDSFLYLHMYMLNYECQYLVKFCTDNITTDIIVGVHFSWLILVFII